MIPLVISTYPENGSKEVVLNSPIKITFASAINTSSVTAARIKLENLNKNDGASIPLTFSFSSDSKEITITPTVGDGEDLFFGLTKYKLSMVNISSPQGEMMQGLHTMEFTTVSGTPEDVVEDPVMGSYFSIINFYPKQSGYGVTPTVVKVKFSDSVLESSANADTFKITSGLIEDISDVGFIDTEYITGTYEVTGDIVSFTPDTPLSDNTKYTVCISGIKSADGTEIEPMLYSFYTKITPLYTSLESIQTTYASIAVIINSTDPMNIIEIIKANSEMALWIAQNSDNDGNITWNPPDKIVVEYVKAKTRYDLVFDRYIQMGNEASSKALGDLEISYDKSIKDLLDLADKLKMSYTYWENLLKGSTSGRSRPQPFRKGEEVDDDPDYKNRQLKDWEGTKSW